MPKKMPKTLFVTVRNDGECDYFTDKNADPLVSMSEKIVVGRYQLAETFSAEGVAKITPARARK